MDIGRRGFLGALVAPFVARIVGLWRKPAPINAASIAAQVEAIRPQLEPLMLLSSILWDRIEVRTDMTPVGSRPTRVPTQPITGGAFGVFGPDGQDMGLGSGPQEWFRIQSAPVDFYETSMANSSGIFSLTYENPRFIHESEFTDGPHA